ncbi:MAG: hypothetical protein U0414_38880 [Polyangiaceae bacterium]
MKQPPIRFIDDERFSASLRADLRDAKDTPPIDYDERAGLERFSALIAVPAVGVAAVAATKAAAASAAGATSAATTVSAAAVTGVKAGIGVKLAIGFIAATSLVTGSVYLATRPAEPAPPPAQTAVALGKAPPREAPRPAKVEPTAAPRPDPEVAPTASAAAPKAAPQASASADPKAAVTAEMAQYAEIRSASGDPARALQLANEGHAKFPRGVFWQEREIIAIQSLQRLGRADEAKRRSDAFVAAHPESMYAESLRTKAP